MLRLALGLVLEAFWSKAALGLVVIRQSSPVGHFKPKLQNFALAKQITAPLWRKAPCAKGK
jgi:hypothetical protein